jgi:hypothetical protein
MDMPNLKMKRFCMRTYCGSQKAMQMSALLQRLLACLGHGSCQNTDWTGNGAPSMWVRCTDKNRRQQS